MPVSCCCYRFLLFVLYFIRFALYGVLALSIPVADAVQSIATTNSHVQNNRFHDLGFVTQDQLAYKSRQDFRCSGQYFHHYLLTDEQKPENFYGYAEQIHYVGDRTLLSGKVELYHQGKRMLANEALFDHAKHSLQLSGDLRVYDQYSSLIGHDITIHTKANTISSSQAAYVLLDQGMRTRFQAMEQKKDGKVYLSNARLTYCQPGNNSWYLSGKRIKLNPDAGYGAANHVLLHVAGIPVFYFPYLNFPLDDRRRSGLLFPQFASSSLGGNKYSQPVYLNLAPHYDAMLVPSYSSRHGAGLEGELRWLSQYSKNYLAYGHIQDQAIYADSDQAQNRWMTRFVHQGRYQQQDFYLHTFVDYNQVSDRDYFDDIDTVLDVEPANIMPQTGSLLLGYKGLQGSLAWTDYSILDKTAAATGKPYAILPGLKIQQNLDNLAEIAGGTLGLDYHLDYDLFVRDIADALSPQQIAQGKNSAGARGVLATSINLDWSEYWGYIKPEWRWLYRDYQLTQQGLLAASQEQQIHISSLSAGLFFDAYRGANLLQTLEPELYYVRVPFAEQHSLPNFDAANRTFSWQELFSPDRFSGFDRIGDQEKLALGITSRFLSFDGFEHVRLRIAQGLYLRDRQLQIDPGSATEAARNQQPRTPWVTELYYKMRNGWQFNHQLVYNDNNHAQYNRERQTFAMDYASENPALPYLHLDYTENTLVRQLRLQAKTPISRNWSALGMLRYDLEAKNTERNAIGLQYQSCCWNMSFVVFNDYETREHRQNNQGLYLRFGLKGLGNIDTRSGRIDPDIDPLLLK